MSAELDAMRLRAESAESRLREAQVELCKWQKPFDQEMFDAIKEQATHSGSLAAQAVYITALEHALKHAAPALVAELDSMRKNLAGIEFSASGYCPACSGWEATKDRGCERKAHTKTCWLKAAIDAARAAEGESGGGS